MTSSTPSTDVRGAGTRRVAAAGRPLPAGTDRRVPAHLRRDLPARHGDVHGALRRAGPHARRRLRPRAPLHHAGAAGRAARAARTPPRAAGVGAVAAAPGVPSPQPGGPPTPSRSGRGAPSPSTGSPSSASSGASATATIEAVDPASLDDAALADHLRACRRLVTGGYLRHFELHGDDLLPVGLLIARCREWGVDPALATGALAGASIGAACRGGVAVDARHRLRPRLPGMGRAGATARRRRRPPSPPSTCGARARPSTTTSSTCCVADARAAVRLRDDNGAITAAWPMGLLRRAMLAAGRRLCPADPTLAVEATVDELVVAADRRRRRSPSMSSTRRRRERAANSRARRAADARS